jgi:signal transduction histidine kinase
VSVALPLASGGKLVGIYLLGRKLSGNTYQREELELLRPLSNQVASAITNARLYEQIRALNLELEERVRERTKELRDFVSVVYHELSTPITSIRGYSELLLEDRSELLDAKERRYLKTIHSNVQRLVGLVGDLSDISRIEAGQLTIHPEPLALDRAVKETVASLSNMIEEKALRVHLDLATEATRVLGDPQRVVQILTNLVSNACRYTPAGGQIVIASRKLAGSVELAIQDTGIGIHRDELDRIFERFYRSNDPLVQEHRGTGLGLAITKSLLELHGSQLWVESVVGKGSTFGFTLPLAEVGDEL